MLTDTQKVMVCNITTYLLGSCKSMAEALAAHGYDEDALTLEVLQAIDEEIFQCDGCGWWEEICDKNDLSGDALCSDCVDMEVHQD